MAVKLVKIVNANGNVGYVSDTHPGLDNMRRAPSGMKPQPQARDEAPAPVADEAPAGNASTETWRAFAAKQPGFTRAEADGMTRNEIKAEFTEE